MLATLGMSSAIMEPVATARRPAKRQRLTWTDEENELILQKVKKLGTQWDRISAELPGRTADAVRNQCHRLHKMGGISFSPGTYAHLSDESSSEDASGEARTGSAHGRSMWTEEEDRLIVEGVRTFGCKWRRIASMLHGRSDSSVRNRWTRIHEAWGAEIVPPPPQLPKARKTRLPRGKAKRRDDEDDEDDENDYIPTMAPNVFGGSCLMAQHQSYCPIDYAYASADGSLAGSCVLAASVSPTLCATPHASPHVSGWSQKLPMPPHASLSAARWHHPGAALQQPAEHSGSVGETSRGEGEGEGDEEEGMTRAPSPHMPERVLYSAGAAGPSVDFRTAQSFDAALPAVHGLHGRAAAAPCALPTVQQLQRARLGGGAVVLARPLGAPIAVGYHEAPAAAAAPMSDPPASWNEPICGRGCCSASSSTAETVVAAHGTHGAHGAHGAVDAATQYAARAAAMHQGVVSPSSAVQLQPGQQGLLHEFDDLGSSEDLGSSSPPSNRDMEAVDDEVAPLMSLFVDSLDDDGRAVSPSA